MSRIDNYDELRKNLEQNSDAKYRDFSMKICRSNHRILGVRVPQIRKLAKQIQKDNIEEYIAVQPKTYEEVLLRGFLIARLSYDGFLEWFDSQLKYVDDWSTCDLFCSAISKLVKKNQEDFFKNKLKKLLDDNHTFVLRVGIVILKCCYIEQDYLDYIFTEVDKASTNNDYYVKMGLAWLVSECFIKFPTATTAYLLRSKMPTWTFNKTISKICDSYRVDTETKKLLRKMRA